MSKLPNLIIIISLFIFVRQNQSQVFKNCLWLSQYLCGDKCLSLDSSCQCGIESISFKESGNYSCCIHDTKSCEDQESGDVICAQGTKQRWNETCHQQCHQLASYGFTTQACDNMEKCYMNVEACRGKSYCCDNSDLDQCSRENQTLNCNLQFDHEDCGQLENAKFKNYGCKHVHSDEYGFFECANRKDKEHVLFANPPVPLRTKKLAINYNLVLDYNDTSIKCGGNLSFSYEDFNEVRQNNSNHKCHLLDGTAVSLQVLWFDLLQDYSFQFSDVLENY